MNIVRKASHVFVAGMSGTGKTSYGERYIVGSNYERIIIFDHQSEFQERLHLIPCYSFEEFKQRILTERILAFDFTENFGGELEETFDTFCDEVFEWARFTLSKSGYETLFVTDELQKVVGAHTCPKPIKNIMQTGRRYCLDTLLLCQQPNEIHNTIRNQITELACFKLNDPRALEFPAYFGLDPDDVQNLERLHYIWRQTHTGEERRSKIDFPKSAA